MADLATLKTRLTDAEGALHQMMMGRTVTQTGYTDHNVAFAQASRADIEAYIEGLKRQIAALDPTVSRGAGRRRFPVVF